MASKVVSMAEDSPWLFLRKFLRHGTRVASVAPSSRFLARAMCHFVAPDRPQTILELGAGTGAITVVAAAKMHPESKLLAVELDADFAGVLAARCPRATVLCCDVAELSERLPALGVERVELVLSGLPTPSLPRAVNTAVFETFTRCAPDACFSQLTVMPWYYWPLYRRLFEQVDFQLVPLNFPSGGVYHCRRLRPDWREHLPGHG
jgi:phosphatidylethanolamine/phosphatidyl-N-methylethanolamine N-methyltransferase